jgi:hypothetical protein
MVLVTPKLILPSDAPSALPTGEPEGWRWSGSMKMRPKAAGDTTSAK